MVLAFGFEVETRPRLPGPSAREVAERVIATVGIGAARRLADREFWIDGGAMIRVVPVTGEAVMFEGLRSIVAFILSDPAGAAALFAAGFSVSVVPPVPVKPVKGRKRP